ncbi:MAG TPA: hypothetical protein DEB39_12685 [Planctomycetaceae bacterium]|nr:hypothetical protein [Planctomycetaceae bacterium]
MVLARCKAVLGNETYTYAKSLVIAHADVDKMNEVGRGCCTVTLGDMDSTRIDRSATINHEILIGIIFQIPVEADGYDWQLRYMQHEQDLIADFLGKTLHLGGGPAIKFLCGTKDMPGAVHQHDINKASVDETSCFVGAVSFLVRIEQ